MRLLDAQSFIYQGVARLIQCDALRAPPYAILSHTWSSEEVLFQDIALGPDHTFSVDTDVSVDKSPTFDQLMRLHNSPTPEIICVECSSKRFQRSQVSDTFCATNQASVCAESHSKQFDLPREKTNVRPKAGWNKLANACLQACKDRYQYIWIDTCCIDKSSSAELSEAINSMFEWYARSDVCYVYLEDCVDCPLRERNEPPLSGLSSGAPVERSRYGINKCIVARLGTCKWLSRGWTLQELIAPGCVIFFDRTWIPLFERSEECDALHGITGIPIRLLSHRNSPDIFSFHWGSSRKDQVLHELRETLRKLSVLEKMSWVSTRETTKVEDIAYCLLGIFGVNMPLLYGEGPRALGRLQDTILKVNVDQIIFAWECNLGTWEETWVYNDMVLAPNPRHFRWWRWFKKHIRGKLSVTMSIRFPESFELTNAGLQIPLRCLNACIVRRKAVLLYTWPRWWIFDDLLTYADSGDRIDAISGGVSGSGELEESCCSDVPVGRSSPGKFLEKDYENRHDGFIPRKRNNNSIASINQDEAIRSDKGESNASTSNLGRLSCALLDYELEIDDMRHHPKRYIVAIQLRRIQKGTRCKYKPATGDYLFRQGDFPHRLLFVEAKAVGCVGRQAMSIRHDFAAW